MHPPQVDPSTVTVVAHRGSSYDFPEHSLEAYEDAIKVGADGLECDVRLTADGHLVCVHDSTLERTSSGRGPLADRTLAQLRDLDWGVTSGGPLTLRQLCELVKDHDRRIELAIETKHPNRHSGRVEQAVADLLEEFGWRHCSPQRPSPARVMSFSGQALRRMASAAPDLTLVYLLEHPRQVATSTRLPGGATVCGVDVQLLHSQPEWVRQIVEAGNRLHVWTVDQESEMATCLQVGATGIITNRPALALAYLGRDE